MQFRAMVSHVAALQRTDLAQGLEAVGNLALPYQYSPANFSGSGVTWGAQFWRVNQFTTACNCWKLVQQNFSPDLTTG